ncbi:MAG: hypothetical protein KJO07_18225 [Deltaproteobacteria bacterium]|jgi:hypothetical protein|nr:hypothetical protein [Deltaproteobacteria bacterium]
MKLVESDVPDMPTGDVPKPRPPRRRVAVSLLFTLSVLVATVVAVYVVFPARHNEALAIAIESHRDPEPYELDKPSRGEVLAWSIGVHAKRVPWPELDRDVVLVGAYGLRIFRQPTSVLRLEVGGQPVTLMALKVRDTPRRKRRLVDDELIAQKWRVKKWTFIAVGPRDIADRWRPVVESK